MDYYIRKKTVKRMGWLEAYTKIDGKDFYHLSAVHSPKSARAWGIEPEELWIKAKGAPISPLVKKWVWITQ